MVIIVMGVSGCGKTTVGRLLAQTIGATFLDADDFHTPASVEKMRAGTPLTDDDRAGWLERLRAEVARFLANGSPLVLACSALRESYRRTLAHPGEDVCFVHPKGAFEQIHPRISGRSDHYMPASLLRSQFATLEEPAYALTIDVDIKPDEAVARIVRHLERKNFSPHP
ncbi:MAG: gluconokinase [Opitutaceae bacterium]